MLPLSFVGAPLEMTKRRWKELMQALYENHFDPRKDEELKQSKLDIENKLPKIFKLIKERRANRKNRNHNVEANLRKESELIELIEDFHKQYQFVYGQYDDIRGQLSQTVHGAKEDEGYFTATSSSDSDTELEKGVVAIKDESMSSKYVKAVNKAQDNEKIMQELKEKLDEKRREVSSIVEIQKRCQKEVTSLVKELQSEFLLLNRVFDGMQPEKIVSEQQKVENRQLQDQASKLEEIGKEMDGVVSQVVKNGVEGVTEEEGFVLDVSKIKGLIIQVNHLKQNVKSLTSNAQKTDSEQQNMGQDSKNGYAVHENLMDQVNKMKRDLGFMRKKNTELELDVKKKAEENSGFLSQMDDLKKEVASKTQELRKEREGSVVRMKKLELEVENLSNQRNEKEKLLAKKEQEHRKLTQEIEGLRGKVMKMEIKLKERQDDKSAQINHIEQELESKNELERQISIKNNDISRLTGEKESLQGRILELEKKLQDERDEYSKLQNDITQKELLTKEASQLQQEEGMKSKLDKQVNSHDKEINKFGEENGSLQEKVLELEDEIVDLQITSQVGVKEVSYLQGELSVERRKFSERLNELETRNNELSFKVSDQEFMIKQHEDTIKKLKEDCKLMKGRFVQAAERKVDELAEEFRKNFEDNMRILSRRIKVAEQLHVETKESWQKTQERCELQHPGLQKRLAQMMMTSSGKSELRATVSQGVNEMVKGMEELVSNLESKEDDFLQRLSKVSNEIQVAKNWVKWTMDGIKPWKNELPQSSVFAPMMDDNEQDKMMKEKVKRLEETVNKEKGDKLKLMKRMYDMQKKVAELENEVGMKDEGLLRLGEEKVEAIRQLCMWVDYQQNRFDQLKEVMLVKKTKSRGRA